MTSYRTMRLRKMRHIYQLLHRVQINGFDESMWRQVLIHGLHQYFDLRCIWNAVITDSRVSCEQNTFDELALAVGSHTLIQMCDQFEQRWTRSVDHPSFDTSEVIDWVNLMLDDQSVVWYQNNQVRLEVVKFADKTMVLLTYKLNSRNLRCMLFEVPDRFNGRSGGLRLRRLCRLLLLELQRMIKKSRLSMECYLSTPLSPRESQTARLLLQGYTEKQIARQLYLSPHTVHSYIKAVYRLFGVSSRAEFSALFISHVPMDHFFKVGRYGVDADQKQAHSSRTVAM